MRSLLILFSFVYHVIGRTETFFWNPMDEYHYRYTTHVFTGIPELNNQYSKYKSNGISVFAWFHSYRMAHPIKLKLAENFRLGQGMV